MIKQDIKVNSEKLNDFCFLAKDYQIKIISTRDLGNGVFVVKVGCYVALTLFNFGLAIGLFFPITSNN